MKHLLPLLALALVPALASAAPIVPAERVLERLELREAVAARLEGTWRMDVERTLALANPRPLAEKYEFRREPLVVLLARTASARMAALPIFDGGLVNDGHSILPYVLVDRGDALELLVFTPAEGTSFGHAEVIPIHLVPGANGPLLYLGGSDPRRARSVYAFARVAEAKPAAPIRISVERAPVALPAEPASH